MVKFTSGQKTKEKGDKNMKEYENQIIKVCSFYVNDWHLTTMILPHIKRTIEENTKVLTILENSIKNRVEELLSKMNLNPITQNKILEINWTSSLICKYSDIKNKIESVASDIEQINIIVNGTEEYIEIANSNIEKVIKNVKGKKVTIINCYEVTKYKEINQILDKHDFVLNTSGIKNIEEVFPNYKKRESNINNKIV